MPLIAPLRFRNLFIPRSRVLYNLQGMPTAADLRDENQTAGPLYIYQHENLFLLGRDYPVGYH